jgi:recombinational DNA repair protein (RecF pathway)
MSEALIEVCGICDAEIEPTRRVDFTLQDGTTVCEPCFVRETPRRKNDWAN